MNSPLELFGTFITKLLFQVFAAHLQLTNLTGMTSTFREKKEKQILISVILIVATFTLCNSFESVLFILAHQGCLSSLDIFWDYLRPTANFLMVLNSSVNSLIFGICNTTFRNKFADIFLSRFKTKSEEGQLWITKMTPASEHTVNVVTSAPSGQQEIAF